MNTLDKLSLIDRIGRELQATLGYKEIDFYLNEKGVNTNKPTSGVNSKWVYVKDLLTDESDEKILRIADELNLSHNYVVTPEAQSLEATFWEPKHFRLFISHLSSFKQTTAQLQRQLRPYGISAFVAHVDIEPTREWELEIEAGLASMDALAAILMPGFKESHWTDQEVGIAVGRGILVIPVIRDLNPYGFISKYQGLQTKGKTVGQVAKDIFQTLVTSQKTRNRMLTALTDTALSATNQDEALRKLSLIEHIDDLPSAYLERMRDGAPGSAIFEEGAPLSALDRLLRARGVAQVQPSEVQPSAEGDDLPF